MSGRGLSVGLLILLLHMSFGTFSHAESGPEDPQAIDTIHIPLGKVWAYKMPGTRDIEQIPFDDYPGKWSKGGPTAEEFRSRTIKSLRATLSSRLPDRETRTGEAVRLPPGGSALRAIGRSVVGKSPLRNLLVEGGETTILFFSHPCNYFVHLQRVTRRGNVIHIAYQFVPHKSPLPTVHFALIPLGKLPPGDYQVEISQIPLDQQYIDGGFLPVTDAMAKRLVCRSFSFRIWKRLQEDPGLADGATEIPLGDIWALGMPGTRQIGPGMGSEPGGNAVPVRKLLADIREQLGEEHRPAKDDWAPPAFVVAGTGMEALRHARDVLVEEKPSLQSVRMGDEASIVFYCYTFYSPVHLHRVEVKNNTITIRYRFVQTMTPDRSDHIALIPVRNVVPGEVKVEIVQLSMERLTSEEEARFSPRELPWGQYLVSGSFSFLVGNKTTPKVQQGDIQNTKQ